MSKFIEVCGGPENAAAEAMLFQTYYCLEPWNRDAEQSAATIASLQKDECWWNHLPSPAKQYMTPNYDDPDALQAARRKVRNSLSGIAGLFRKKG